MKARKELYEEEELTREVEVQLGRTPAWRKRHENAEEPSTPTRSPPTNPFKTPPTRKRKHDTTDDAGKEAQREEEEAEEEREEEEEEEEGSNEEKDEDDPKSLKRSKVVQEQMGEEGAPSMLWQQLKVNDYARVLGTEEKSMVIDLPSAENRGMFTFRCPYNATDSVRELASLVVPYSTEFKLYKGQAVRLIKRGQDSEEKFMVEDDEHYTVTKVKVTQSTRDGNIRLSPRRQLTIRGPSGKKQICDDRYDVSTESGDVVCKGDKLQKRSRGFERYELGSTTQYVRLVDGTGITLQEHKKHVVPFELNNEWRC
jgi:hypothetical protein